MSEELNHLDQDNWELIFDNSAWSSYASIKREFGLDPASFSKYLSCRKSPYKKNQKKMEDIMLELNKTKKLEKHPSYGYATEEQIKKLQDIGLCPERDQIMKQIETQNNNKGKYK